ncbi:MAG TPA: tetratricopeptide repeat protein [Candidatus Obscuribacter sp.]|nr:tetratricopeptide repeat protein [Candidatus Obscuribacter sp.]HND04360.1 tetratricopeptide repeat protein [Candidatus Obscuribacter sp.]HND67626.1 tetratricopeptide repeat protein [Candidatus Obscuribacter sp.]HNH72672.1 tetratricopeptide repeat protein [Candidatus Obscuribacter sp.]
MQTPFAQVVSDLVSQGRWDEAYSGLVQYTQQNPGMDARDPAMQFQLGVLAFNSGKVAEAERHLKTSLSIDSDNPDSHYQLGLVLLKDGRPEDAMPEFREACERRANFAVGHLHWGIALGAMGNTRGALAQFNQALKIDANLTAAYIEGGLVCFQLGQFMEAAQYFQAAVNLEPELPEPLVSLGISLSQLGNEVDAGKCFMRAWQLDGRNVAVLRHAASAMAYQGQIDEAVKLFQEAVNLGHRGLNARERALIYNDWGVALFRVGMAEEAGQKLMEAADMDPTSVEPCMNLGLVSVQLGEFERAADAFEKTLALEPESRDLRVYLAVTLILLNQCELAIERMDEKAPDNPGQYEFWLGHAHLGAGNYEQAARYFAQVLQDTPANYQAVDGLGCALMLSGNYEDAIERFKTAISLRQDYALGHLHLSRALDQMGDQAAAQAHLKEAILYDPECLTPQKEALDKLLKAAQYELVQSQSMKILAVSPRDSDVRVALARAYKEQNRLDEALEAIESVLMEDPSNAAARVVAGQIFLSQGRFVEADENFRIASETTDGDHALFYAWGKTLSLLGLVELALEKYEKACELDPYDADVYDAWGTALKTLGRFTEAAEVYKRASEYI